MSFILTTICFGMPVSNPHVDDSKINKVIPNYLDTKDSKVAFHERSPTKLEERNVNSINLATNSKSNKKNSSKFNDKLKVTMEDGKVKTGKIDPQKEYNDDGSCNVDIHLRWSASCGSSIYAPPVIYPSGHSGKKQIFVNTFYQYIEALGYDGYKPWGWPLSFEGSSFQGSPIIHDIDNDGVNDIGSVDKDGNLFWVKLGDFGQYLEDFHVKIPKLKIQKDWSDKLDPEFSDHQVMITMFEHEHNHGDLDLDSLHGSMTNRETGGKAKLEGLTKSLNKDNKKIGRSSSRRNNHVELGKDTTNSDKGSKQRQNKNTRTKVRSSSSSSRSGKSNSNNHINIDSVAYVETGSRQEDKRATTKKKGTSSSSTISSSTSGGGSSHYNPVHRRLESVSASATESRETLYQAQSHDEEGIDKQREVREGAGAGTGAGEEEEEEEESSNDDEVHAVGDFGDGGTRSGRDNENHKKYSFLGDDGLHPAHHDHEASEHRHSDYNPNHIKVENWEDVGDDKEPTAPPLPEDDFHMDMHYMYGKGNPYGDDMPFYQDTTFNDSHFVFVDAHVLGSPTLSDVNGDGHLDVVMAVSYYFDKARYAGKTNEDLGFDPSLYVAGGIVCWDLELEMWSWSVHLDLTTDHTRFKALIHGSPSVADLDGDGVSEVIIGTSLGLLYVLDGDTGFVRRHFPMQFHEIQSTVAVADIQGNSDLEIIVADMGGNLVVINAQGEVIWDISLSGVLPFTPTIGDVNGDGQLDIVVVAASEEDNSNSGDAMSHLWAIDGSTGLVLEGYPRSLPSNAIASAPVLLVDLHDYYRGIAMTPTRYADPNLPPWMQATRGHQPAPAPSYGFESNQKRGNNDSDTNLNTDNYYKEQKKKIEDAAFMEALAGLEAGHPLGPLALSVRRNIQKSRGLHLVVPSFDGYLYIIDGIQGCAERVDVGQHIYSMPLADDVTGDGMLDIVLGTMNGEVLLLETNVPYHALNAWPSFPKHRLNGFTHGVTGISVPLSERRLLENAVVKGGNMVKVTFDIWDSRRNVGISSSEHTTTSEGGGLHGNNGNNNGGKVHYKVSFTRGASRSDPLLEVEYSQPGRYSVDLPVSPPEAMTLVIGMVNEHNQYYEETLPLAVSTGYYVWIKYLILTPLALFFLPIQLYKTHTD